VSGREKQPRRAASSLTARAVGSTRGLEDVDGVCPPAAGRDPPSHKATARTQARPRTLTVAPRMPSGGSQMLTDPIAKVGRIAGAPFACRARNDRMTLLRKVESGLQLWPCPAREESARHALDVVVLPKSSHGYRVIRLVGTLATRVPANLERWAEQDRCRGRSSMAEHLLM
jgi:hypothetical protein